LASRIDEYLQTKLFTLLDGDAALATLVGSNKVFEFIPDNTALPYVEIGAITQSGDFGGHDFSGFDGEYEIHTWSDTTGNEQCQQIMNRVYEILHGRDLDLAGGFKTLSNRCVSSSIEKDPDGRTRHGVQRFELLTGGN